MANEDRTFKIPSRNILVQTVEGLPEGLHQLYCKLEASLTNNSISQGTKTEVEEFLRVGKLQRQVKIRAEGSEKLGTAKRSIVYLLRRGYRGRIDFTAYYKWYMEYPDPIEYQYAQLNIDGNVLRLRCDSKFPLRLKEAFENVLSLYSKKEVTVR